MYCLTLGAFIMRRKAKYTFEQKLQAVLDYQSGKKSAADIALELDRMDYHKTSWQQSTTFQVPLSLELGSNGIITIWNRGTMIPIRRSIWQKERKQRKKNEWKSFNTVSIMIAIIKKQPQNMDAVIHRFIHGSVNMTSKERMA